MLFLLTNFVKKEIGENFGNFCQISDITKLKNEKKKHLIIHVKLQMCSTSGHLFNFFIGD